MKVALYFRRPVGSIKAAKALPDIRKKFQKVKKAEKQRRWSPAQSYGGLFGFIKIYDGTKEEYL